MQKTGDFFKKDWIRQKKEPYLRISKGKFLKLALFLLFWKHLIGSGKPLGSGVIRLKISCLHYHLDEAPQQLEAVEDDNCTADYVDDAQCLVGKLGTE